jgi:glycosyltransferase involved in cell wall biosynthesis
MRQSKEPQVAIVHDWLTTMGGAEQVVLELHKLYPNAPIYTSVYNRAALPAFANLDVRTTWMQKALPKSVRYKHVLWPVLRSYAFRSLDLSRYDLIISSASAEAKAVVKRPGATHVCYCHTPIRYYYSHYDEFRREFTFGPLTPLIRPFIPQLVKWMRHRDQESLKGVDAFIANSSVTAERVKEYYGRGSVIVNPPVDIRKFAANTTTERSGYIIWGRHVPYKRFDHAVIACSKLGVPLTVVGAGPDTDRLKSLAGPTVTFTGRISDIELVSRAYSAKGFLFPGEEDFGMSAVEALSAGLPVIGYAKGGILDIVTDGKTGVLYETQSTEALAGAIKRAEAIEFKRIDLTNRSKHFAPELFDNKVIQIISKVIHK